MRAKFIGILTAAVIVFAGLVAPNLSNAAPPTATSHPITFDANGGSGVMNKQIISIKGKNFLPTNLLETHIDLLAGHSPGQAQ